MIDLLCLFRDYLKVTTDIIIVHSRGIIRWNNRHLSRILKRDLVSLFGTSFSSLIDEAYQDRLPGLLYGTSSAIIKMLPAGGGELWVELSGIPVHLENCEEVRLLVGRDITLIREGAQDLKLVIESLLPRRQAELFSLIVAGLDRAGIIREMDIDPDTYRQYLFRLLRKFNMLERRDQFWALIEFLREP